MSQKKLKTFIITALYTITLAFLVMWIVDGVLTIKTIIFSYWQIKKSTPGLPKRIAAPNDKKLTINDNFFNIFISGADQVNYSVVSSLLGELKWRLTYRHFFFFIITSLMSSYSYLKFFLIINDIYKSEKNKELKHSYKQVLITGISIKSGYNLYVNGTELIGLKVTFKGNRR